MEKEKQTKPKASRKKDIIGIGVDIIEIDNLKNDRKLMKPKTSFENINEIDKYLSKE